MTATATETRYGKTLPRVYTPPLVDGPPGPCGCGCALSPATSHGFSVISFAQDYLGINLFPWQRWLLIHMLELNSLGKYRFRTIVILVARQNGKSTLSQVLGLWWLYVYGVKTILSAAQDLPTAEKIWDEAVEMAATHPELSLGIGKVVYTNGKRELRLKRDQPFKGGSWYVKTASRSAGRGFTGGRVLLDELREHQSWDAWGAITKTTMAVQDAQVITLSNAGDDNAVVLNHLRMEAHKAVGDPDGIYREHQELALAADLERMADEIEDFDPDEFLDQFGDDLAIFEWSAVPGCSLTDRDQWAQANPSLGYTITERTIASALRTDPEVVFRTEVLCQKVDGSIKGDGFAADTWPKTEITLPEGVKPNSELALMHARIHQIVGKVRVAFELSSNRRWGYVCVAGWRADEHAQVEVAHRQAGDHWLKAWLMDPQRRGTIEMLVGQGRGAPASPTLAELKEAYEDPEDPFDVPVRLLEGPEVPASYARIHDWVRDGKVWHFKQPALNTAAVHGRTKRAGDGKMWDRTGSPVDIAPLVGCSEALYVLTEESQAPRRSAYADRGLVTV